jgi:hypothetical protein
MFEGNMMKSSKSITGVTLVRDEFLAHKAVKAVVGTGGYKKTTTGQCCILEKDE